MRRRDTRLPIGRNPRTAAARARIAPRSIPTDVDYVDAVLGMFRQQPFFYTLSRPRSAANSVDEFLFDTGEASAGIRLRVRGC